jgi:hypothetical protein
MSEPHISKPARSEAHATATKGGSLSGTLAMPPDAWDKFRKEWRNPYGRKSSRQVLDALCGEAELPPKKRRLATA